MEAELNFCRKHGRAPTEGERADIREQVKDPSDRGFRMLAALYSDIKSAGTDEAVDSLLEIAAAAAAKAIGDAEDELADCLAA